MGERKALPVAACQPLSAKKKWRIVACKSREWWLKLVNTSLKRNRICTWPHSISTQITV